MTKQDLATLLRSVGCNENTITAMENAFDMGVAYEREACANLCEDQAQEYYSDGSKRAMNYQCADAIRARGEA